MRRKMRHRSIAICLKSCGKLVLRWLKNREGCLITSFFRMKRSKLLLG